MHYDPTIRHRVGHTNKKYIECIYSCMDKYGYDINVRMSYGHTYDSSCLGHVYDYEQWCSQTAVASVPSVSKGRDRSLERSQMD